MKILNLNIRNIVLVCFVSIYFLAVSFVSAHEGGESFEKVVGNYKFDIGYEPSAFISLESQRFDFDIYDAKTNNEVDFSDVWVNISQGNKTVFAGGVYKSDLGGAGMTFTFPEKGDYVMSVRFQNNGSSIVESTFPIEVVALAEEGVSNESESKDYLGWILGGTTGFIIGFFLSKILFNKS